MGGFAVCDVKLILCFLDSLEGIGFDLGAGRVFLLSGSLLVSSHLFFFGDGLVTLDLLALSLFSLLDLLCRANSFPISYFLDER